MEIQRATSGNLLSLMLHGLRPTVLLGAGASVTSGIPLAGETAERAAKWAWCQAHGKSLEDIRIRRSDYWPWLCGQPWYSEEKPIDQQYPAVIENLLGVKRSRREFFEKLISPGVPPSIGYRCLARILNEGFVSTVLTTNFDHCLEEARTLENKPHMLVPIRTESDLVRFTTSPSAPQLIYLHGSVEHYSDKNLVEETNSLPGGITERLIPILRDHPILVIGYRGGETSIMKDLFLDHVGDTLSFSNGIYWCTRDVDMATAIAPMVQELANAIGRNFQLVPIEGFDQLLEKQLWNQITAVSAPPVRAAARFPQVGIPADMRPLTGTSLEDLDETVMFARLSRYAGRLGFGVPENFNSKWLRGEAYARDLVVESAETTVPTVAGWLLFSRTPTTHFPHASVEFRAEGPPGWIRRCFGDDAEISTLDENGRAFVERDVRGNLWTQLDVLSDLIAHVNQGFRLKEEISRTVYPYAPVAIKEILVNALVHRDYERAEPIVVRISPEALDVVSPGGLVPEVEHQTGGKRLENVISTGVRGIKGYRNPVISDLFYGGGQMDRAGSGLADVWLATINNNGEAHFGPDEDNRFFAVNICARPESVDLVTNTAVPVGGETVRYAANILPIETMPTWIWHAGTTARSAGSLKKNAPGLAIPPGYVNDGRFFSLFDLEALTESSVTPFDRGDVEVMSLSDALAQPNGENIVIALMNSALGDHLRTLGLWVEYKRRRAYFPKSSEGERKITYRGRIKRATRTVVKSRTRRDSADVLYYEHKAVAFSVLRFGDDWAVSLAPCYAFTLDGEGKALDREKTNVLSTRRAARDFNASVHHDVTFWAAAISEEADGVFGLRCTFDKELESFAPTVLMSSRLPTVSFSSTSFDPDSDDELNDDDALAELDDELALIAEEAHRDDMKGSNDD